MKNDFLFVQNLVDCLCGMSVHLVPCTQEGVLALAETVFQELLPQTQTEQLLGRALRTITPDRIFHLQSIPGLRYSLFRSGETGQLLVIGPCRDESYSEKDVAFWLHQRQVSQRMVRKLLDFCRQQPAVSYDRLYSLSQLLAQQLGSRSAPLPHEELSMDWSETHPLLESVSFTELEEIRSVETRYEASAVMTEAVKQGNLSLAYRYIQKMNSVPEDLIRSENALRNAQNLCIVMNTQLRHAMEEEGVHPYRLNQLSGNIGQQIEKLKSQAAANNFFSQILRQYCELAQEERLQGLSPFARLAVAYIQTHLSDNITVKSAAEALLVNPDYLSYRFHREVGVPFIEYVNQQRIRQAAALLKRTELQVQQISSAVGYNNASYFTKQFVKFMGLTPRNYRTQT